MRLTALGMLMILLGACASTPTKASNTIVSGSLEHSYQALSQRLAQ